MIRAAGVLYTVSIGFMLVTFFFVESFKLRDDVEEEAGGIKRLVFSKENSTNIVFGRKLLQSTDGRDMNRISTTCSKEDIVIYQGQTAPLPNGIPTYSVQILNTCASGCSISNIHVSCGWFSSDHLVNPTVFRRIYYDDCLVNDGLPLAPGQTLSFQYASTYLYPLSVTSVSCC